LNRFRKFADWFRDAQKFGWKLPPRPVWYRIPVVKRLYHFLMAYRVERQRSTSEPRARSGYDLWCLYGWWHGLETR